MGAQERMKDNFDQIIGQINVLSSIPQETKKESEENVETKQDFLSNSINYYKLNVVLNQENEEKIISSLVDDEKQIAQSLLKLIDLRKKYLFVDHQSC